MRWTIDGAESLLHLRCAFAPTPVGRPCDWDAFHTFRRRQRHSKLYLVPYPDPPAPLELAVLHNSPDSLLTLAA